MEVCTIEWYEKILVRTVMNMKYTRTDVFEDVYNNYDDGSDKYTSAKDSKFRDYRRKVDMLKNKFPELRCVSGKRSNEIEFSKDERDILYALLHEAVKGNSLMAQWLRYGNQDMSSEQIVDMYESLVRCLYAEAEISGWGEKPTIDTWLHSFDVMVDYSLSKRIVGIKNKAEKLRIKTKIINHQIDIGSIVCNSEEGSYYANRLVYPYYEEDSATPPDINPMDYAKYSNSNQYLQGLERLIELYNDDIDGKNKIVSQGIINCAWLCYLMNGEDLPIDEYAEKEVDKPEEVEIDSATSLEYRLFYNAVADIMSKDINLLDLTVESFVSKLKESDYNYWKSIIKEKEDVIKMIRTMAKYV